MNYEEAAWDGCGLGSVVAVGGMHIENMPGVQRLDESSLLVVDGSSLHLSSCPCATICVLGDMGKKM